MPETAAIVLAAGGSSRMGRPKQLLPYKGRTLLRHAVEVAVASRCRPVFVVIGCQAHTMREILAGLPVLPVECPSWQAGMGESLREGIFAVDQCSPEVDSAIVMLCDQPLVTKETLDALVRAYRAGEGKIVASEYGDAVGAPALFDRSLFSEMLQIPPQQGARQFIDAHRSLTSRIIFPAGAVDIDYPAEYNALAEVAAEDGAA